MDSKALMAQRMRVEDAAGTSGVDMNAVGDERRNPFDTPVVSSSSVPHIG